MLHGATFLATCVNAKQVRGDVTRSQYLFATCNAPTGNDQLFLLSPSWNLSRGAKRRPLSEWLIFTKLRCILRWTCHVQGLVSQLTLRKVEDSSAFLATRNTTFCGIAGCKNGVLHVKSCLQLVRQRLLRHKAFRVFSFTKRPQL